MDGFKDRTYFCNFFFIKPFTFFEATVFGSLISATDPVSVLSIFKEINANTKLNSLIFGESILNDAITLTLYRALIHWNYNPDLRVINVLGNFGLLMVGSCLLGLSFGLIAAFVQFFAYLDPYEDRFEISGALEVRTLYNDYSSLCSLSNCRGRFSNYF